MKHDRVLAAGVNVSNDTRITGFNNNDLIIGSSGCGKTGGYVVPNLQNLEGSIVVSDTKGQLCKMFAKELKSKGYKVHTLDLVNPEKSCGYNPLRGIRRYKNGKYREQDVLTLATNIVPTLDATEPFWEQAAAGYLAFLIAFCLETLPVEKQNMVSVCNLHTRFIKPNGRLSFIQWVETHPNTFAAKKYAKACSAMVAERMWSSIVEFANRALEPFDFEEARTIFENSKSFDISRLGTEKTALFLNVSDTDRTFDNLINVFYTQALQILCSLADSNPGGRLKVPVRIIIDDFAASSALQDFDKIISTIRSRDVSVSLILQSMTQLDSMYSPAEATTIVNNCDHIIYLGSQDLETANFIGNRIFKTPDEVLCIPRDKAVVITTGEKAVISEKIKPYSTLK
ncbi:MAG: type IV secretory system conjugative DNA transfer family protein [Eubacterium sp.]|nr:type IV secretory system conjugative DNA transfer family protein [Eubacterium sp.]